MFVTNKCVVTCGTNAVAFALQEAFAVVREASKRVLGLRPFDVPLLGEICCFQFYNFKQD